MTLSRHISLIFLLSIGLITCALAQDDAGARKGKIAVLPFNYVTNDASLPVDQYKELVQSHCATVFREEAKKLEVQDPMTTNTLLLRNEMSGENLAKFLPSEIAEALGVQYVVFGTFNLTNKGTTSYGSSSSSYNEKEKKETDENERETKSKGTSSTYSSSSSYTNYEADMEMRIFDDTGQTVYSRSHQPFNADPAEYDATLKWLIRRSPWGRKAGK